MNLDTVFIYSEFYYFVTFYALKKNRRGTIFIVGNLRVSGCLLDWISMQLLCAQHFLWDTVGIYPLSFYSSKTHQDQVVVFILRFSRSDVPSILIMSLSKISAHNVSRCMDIIRLFWIVERSNRKSEYTGVHISIGISSGGKPRKRVGSHESGKTNHDLWMTTTHNCKIIAVIGDEHASCKQTLWRNLLF